MRRLPEEGYLLIGCGVPTHAAAASPPLVIFAGAIRNVMLPGSDLLFESCEVIRKERIRRLLTVRIFMPPCVRAVDVGKGALGEIVARVMRLPRSIHVLV